MKLRLLTKFTQNTTGLIVDVGSGAQTLIFGDDIPMPGMGWSVVQIISLDQTWHIFHLKNGTETGYWFFDADFHFVANQATDFIGNGVTSAALSRVTVFEYDTDLATALAVIYDLLEEMVVAISRNVHMQPDLRMLRVDQPYAPVSNILNQLNTPRVPSSIFHEIIVKESLLDGYIFAEDEILGRMEFDRFLPIENFWYIGFSSDGTHDYIAFITLHNKSVVALYDPNANIMWSNVDLSRIGFNQNFYGYARLVMFWLSSLLGQSQAPTFHKMGVMFRENHIGHYIWNELSTVYLLKRLGRDVHAFLYSSCNEPVFAVNDVFPDMDGKVIRDITNFDILSASIVEGIEFFPFMSFHIEENFAAILAQRSVDQESEFNAEMIDARKNSFVLLIGLRLENRSWVAQKEGYIALMDELATLDNKFTVLFDGHNYLNAETRTFIRSHQENYSLAENAVPEIVNREVEIIDEVMAHVRTQGYKNLHVINLVPCSVARSIVAALNCDYLVTHWGAGLAKYKWIANAEGCVISPRSVIESKGDLRIYDVPEFRENATPLFYYPAERITDLGAHTHLISINDHDRNDFDLDKALFAKSVRDIVRSKLETATGKNI